MNTPRRAVPALTAKLLGGLIRAYQLAVSPLFPPRCRFLPTCSEYAFEAITRHGAGKGLWLALKRLTRCRPGCPGGHDPVP